jgi:hypothetical protein
MTFQNPLLNGKFAIEAAYISESGEAFLVTADAYYLTKVSKKPPEESKVTKLMLSHGWKMTQGNKAFLIFKQPGYPAGELMVVRGTKKWFWDIEGEQEAIAEGQGLDSLAAAIENGTIGKPKAKAMHASNPAIKSNAPGDHHEEMTMEDALPEHKVGRIPGIENIKSDRQFRDFIRDKKEKEAREVMHDDSGAQTGLRMRPDYGESDSYSVQMNEANSKGACITIEGGFKSKGATIKTPMYVSGVDFVPGDALKIAKFVYSPDPTKALRLPRLTAAAVSAQLNGPDFRLKSSVISTVKAQ